MGQYGLGTEYLFIIYILEHLIANLDLNRAGSDLVATNFL